MKKIVLYNEDVIDKDIWLNLFLFENFKFFENIKFLFVKIYMFMVM